MSIRNKPFFPFEHKDTVILSYLGRRDFDAEDRDR